MTKLPTTVHQALHYLSFIVCRFGDATLSNDFDDLFTDDGFQFLGFTDCDDDELLRLSNSRNTEKPYQRYLKQIFKAGYPDLAAKAHTFLSQHDLL
jgi:hypothetical protein